MSTVLNSWKEIAQYLGRGVRTAQRWERDLNLPVHRPRGRSRSAVIAIPEELDEWLKKTPELPPERSKARLFSKTEVDRILASRTRLDENARDLVANVQIMQKRVEAAIRILKSRRNSPNRISAKTGT